MAYLQLLEAGGAIQSGEGRWVNVRYQQTVVPARRSKRRNRLAVLTLCMRTPSCTPTLSSQLHPLSRPGTFTTASLGGATSLNSHSPPLPSESEAGKKAGSRPILRRTARCDHILGGLNDRRAAVLITAWGISESEMEPADDERVYPPGRRAVEVGGFGANNYVREETYGSPPCTVLGY
jgi:hypothetical protein